MLKRILFGLFDEFGDDRGREHGQPLLRLKRLVFHEAAELEHHSVALEDVHLFVYLNLFAVCETFLFLSADEEGS